MFFERFGLNLGGQLNVKVGGRPIAIRNRRDTATTMAVVPIKVEMAYLEGVYRVMKATIVQDPNRAKRDATIKKVRDEGRESEVKPGIFDIMLDDQYICDQIEARADEIMAEFNSWFHGPVTVQIFNPNHKPLE